MKNNLRNILRFSVFFALGLFFIWLFMRNLTPAQKSEIFYSFRIAKYSWIILAFILGIISHVFRTLRWKILMEPMGYKPGTGNVFMAVMIGYLANLALPRLGEVSRCGILTRYEKIPFNKSFGTVITERAIDMITFLLIFFFMIFTQSGKIHNYIEQKIYIPLEKKFDFELIGQNYLLYLFLGLAVAGIFVLMLIHKKYKSSKIYQKFYHLFLGLLEGIKSLTRIKKPFLFVAYTIGIWIMYLMMAYVVFFSLPETAHLGLDAGLAVLIFGSVGIMVVQGGIGIYPAIVAETLFLWAVPETKGYAMGWLIWGSQTLMILIAGVFSLILLPVLNKTWHDKTGSHSTQDTEPSAGA